MDEKTVRRNLDGRFRRDRIPADVLERYELELEKPLEVLAPAMITADWHMPLFSPAWFNHMMETAEREKIRTLVIGGDLFNMDALARHEPIAQGDRKGRRDMFKAEIAVARSSMRVALEWFDQIYVIWGNHDFRFLRFLQYKTNFKTAMEILLGDEIADERVYISNLDHLWVRPHKDAPSWESWYVCHPENYSKVPLSVARQLSPIHRANVITAHAHHFAYGHAVDGKMRVADAGGLFDHKLQGYLQRTATFPTHQNGYSWIDKDGFLLPFEYGLRDIKEIG